MQPAGTRAYNLRSSTDTCISSSRRPIASKSNDSLPPVDFLASCAYDTNRFDLDQEESGANYNILIPVPLPDSFFCNSCQASFNEYRSLKPHLAQCQKASSQFTFCCSECGERFPDIRVCKLHQQLHKEPSNAQEHGQFIKELLKKCIPCGLDAENVKKNELLSDKIIEHGLLRIIQNHLRTKNPNGVTCISPLVLSIFERHGPNPGHQSNLISAWQLRCDIVLIPVNHGNAHWSLVVLNNQKREYLHLNSIPDKAYDDTAKWYIDALKEFEKVHLKTTLLPSHSIKNIPCSRQVGGVNCGIHVLRNAEEYIRSGSTPLITKEYCEKWRLDFIRDFKEKVLPSGGVSAAPPKKKADRLNDSECMIVYDAGRGVGDTGSTNDAGAGGGQGHQGSGISLFSDIVGVVANMSLSGIVKRVPKAARIHAAAVFKKVVCSVATLNDEDSWLRLFTFAPFCLKKPRAGRGKKSKVSVSEFIKGRLDEYEAAETHVLISQTRIKGNRKNKKPDTLTTQELVAAKLSCGDISGAARVLSSFDTLAESSTETYAGLLSKHPPRPADFSPPDPPANADASSSVFIDEAILKDCIRSFPNGSSGGLDGICPQHLKDMIAEVNGALGKEVLGAMVPFISLMLSGKVPASVLPVLYGARLIALNKKSGGIRPIAVGNAFRRLAAKVGVSSVRPEANHMFVPHQSGFGVKNGAEAVVHAVREYIKGNQNKGKVIVKIDYKNAFNSIRRDVVLSEVKDQVPWLFPFVQQSYLPVSNLIWNQTTVHSAEGVQQGDPLGPFLFNLGINNLVTKIDTELNAWYLDDGTLGGYADKVAAELVALIQGSEKLGLEVNPKKCEILVLSDDPEEIARVQAIFQKIAPGILNISFKQGVLLGSALHEDAIDGLLSEKISDMEKVKSRLMSIDRHEGLFLLRCCLGVPKVTYLLRSSPAFLLEAKLKEYDKVIKDTLEALVNAPVSEDSWELASMPISDGGLGIRRPSDLALPAFMGSSVACKPLVELILSKAAICQDTDDFSRAKDAWKFLEYKESDISKVQKDMDHVMCEKRLDHLRAGAKDNAQWTALILANCAPHSGSWLTALPVESLGLKLSNEECRIAASVRLGARLCVPHDCICGATADERGYHGLSCPVGPDRSARHHAINSVIKRALGTAQVPAIVEPVGLCKDDAKRPDGVTLIPWANGRPAAWDVACINTMCPTHLARSAKEAGSAAADSAQRKKSKYKDLPKDYCFVPLIVETCGVWSGESLGFLKELGKRIYQVTMEPRATCFLLERLSIAVQKGNAECISSTFAKNTFNKY